MKENFGERIKRLRLEKGLKQEQVAVLLQVNRKAVSHYENNMREPSFGILVQLAEIYKVSTDYLLGVDKKRVIYTSGLNDRQYALVRQLVEELTGNGDV